MLLSDLSATSRNWAGDSPTGAMANALRAFASAALGDERLLRDASASLSTESPASAAWIAVALGTVVERGADPQISGPPVLEALRAWLPRLPAGGADATVPEPTPAQARLLAPFQFLCQAAVSHLARLPALRAALGADATLIERLTELGAISHGAWWVREALLKTSGTLVLVHPTGGAGLRLAVRNVVNCFHLFSLLQTAVGTRLPGGRAPDEAIARAARGHGETAVHDAAWWHYGVCTSPRPDPGASLWGESLVRDIPRIDGEQLVLLWPPVLANRAWDAGFLGPHLEAMPADASVERMLDAAEVRAWLERLGIAGDRPWWKFWR